jgi:hypothetical protein
MSAFFFAAGLTRAQVRPSRNQYETAETYQTWDACESGIIYGGELGDAQKQFEATCLLSPEGQKPVETVIKRLVGAQIIEQLLTESGTRPLDWPDIAREVGEEVSATPPDDFEQGYWVDVNQALPPGRTTRDSESLQRDLPEDIRSGLNWSAEKQFLFLVTVLSPPPAPVYVDEVTIQEEAEMGAQNDEDDEEEPARPPLEENIAALAEMRDKEAAAIVLARNSVVAAWLWRKFAADTPLAQNELQVLPVCVPAPIAMKD